MSTLSRKSDVFELENTLESVEKYQALFTEFSFEEEQIEILISKFIKREIILTDINNIKKRIQAFSIFEIPIQKRNLFICNNASLIFNKYPKELETLGVKPNGLNLSLSDQGGMKSPL